MRKVQTWTIGGIRHHLALGDLFAAPVEAIVNSEQTDFILSRSPDSISGQLNRRYGALVADDLARQTGGRVMPPGTVLRTGPAAPFSCIYHAGFHTPDQWLAAPGWEAPGEPGSMEEPEYLTVIRGCVRDILDDAFATGRSSVAFPMLGTGDFGLDPSALAYDFMREIADCALRASAGHSLDVWLVLPRDAGLPRITEALVQAIIDRLSGEHLMAGIELGVPFLDRFAEMQVRSADPRYSALMLTRYAELLVGFMTATLALASSPRKMPGHLLDRGQRATFGWMRQTAQHLALQLEKAADLGPWPRYFVERLVGDKRGPARMLKVNDDRNAIAHGYAARSAQEIAADVRAFIGLESWRELLERAGPPPESGLEPWLASGPGDTVRAVGLLQRWTARQVEYLVPATGETFVRPGGGA
ncbi:MAG: hypothetical protein KC470_14235 [Dehalococcoidia bacterium]|nr:hypothetical protein [Dehalococcoidia bacterium]